MHENYGGILQAYATVSYLENQNIEYELVRYTRKKTVTEALKDVPRLFNAVWFNSRYEGIQRKLSLKKHPEYAGRFSDQKNHSFLLDIFQAVHQKNPNTVLLLFGVGELQEAMKNKARTLGIEDAVIFYGASNEMNKMWQAMDVFVMPSLHEGLPVTGVEAQASGLPCVFSDAITKEVWISQWHHAYKIQKSVCLLWKRPCGSNA